MANIDGLACVICERSHPGLWTVTTVQVYIDHERTRAVVSSITKTAAKTATATATDPPKANLFKTAPLAGPGASAGEPMVEVGTVPVEGAGEPVSGRGEGGEETVVGDGAFAAGGGVFNGEGADFGVFTVVGAGAEACGGGVATGGGDLVGDDLGEDVGDCAIVKPTTYVISIKKTMLLLAAIFVEEKTEMTENKL
ncbi:unnamed protein product [Dovyalis caffra]|uniref:Uncharacterized protein n=1 Tax=Dovyalis caffra TaxID=77055 RepID=A0AAV1R658_9ROSI|nr:unnamed protein product [Dovyalis caffra]